MLARECSTRTVGGDAIACRPVQRLAAGDIQSKADSRSVAILRSACQHARSTGQRRWHILPIANKEALMATRNVVLTETQSDLVDRLVASGRFQNASEALRAGLRLLESEEAALDALRARLQSGLQEARRGEFAEGSGEDAIRRAFAVARARS